MVEVMEFEKFRKIGEMVIGITSVDHLKRPPPPA